MAKRTKKEVAKRTKKEVAKVQNTLPAEFGNVEGFSGFENVDNDCLSIPFLRIAQPLSPQLDEGSENHIQGLKAGDFLNSATNKRYGPTLRVVALGFYRMWVEYEPNRGNFVKTWTTEEFNEQGFKKDGFQYKNGDNDLMDTRNFFVWLPDYPEEGIILFPLSKTGIVYSKKWLTKMGTIAVNGNKAPMFASIWNLKTVRNQNDKGTWFQLGAKGSTNMEWMGFVNNNQAKEVMNLLPIVKDYQEQASNIQVVSKDDHEEF